MKDSHLPNEFDDIVDSVWRDMRRRRERIIRVVGHLWETTFRQRYIRWIRKRGERLECLQEEWNRFLR